MSGPPTLILVYNADGGVFASLADAAHKLISPATYPCSLCAVTYGAVAMKREWRAFLDTLPMPKRFFHRDDFKAAWPALDVALPAILIQHGNAAPELLLGPEALNTQRYVAMLADAVRAALAAHTQAS